MKGEIQNWNNLQLSLTHLIDLALMPSNRDQHFQPPSYKYSRKNNGPPHARQPFYPRHRPYRVPELVPHGQGTYRNLGILSNREVNVGYQSHRNSQQANIRNDTPNSSSPPSSPHSSPSRSGPRSISPWKIQYHIEKEPFSKPSSLLFFDADHPEKFAIERKSAPRPITNIYPAERIFGTGPSRKVEIRQVEVTLSQIWNREVIIKQWERKTQDSEGYLLFEGREMKIQLQRYHVPGALFFSVGGGDLSINDPLNAPDVCFQMVDAPGQEFVRDKLYNLKCKVEIEEGQYEASVLGIDGKEITFEIGGRKRVRLFGEGMSRDWEGRNRGDLLVDIVVVG